ncbi:hypothetical protein C8F04DRAFT_1098948 [Mycena alexandri]|uniref:Uncharacterized protein n=1 Tax=Mycena alexandri TaxID=1745969 RepID=A0AAD6SXM7_9AGAR|nr:hypothetical protein C8F04DRAFT_1098948 [Mycena alexandri]
MTTPYTFRRRTIGRAASPPTWACYEQIHDGEDDEENDDEGEFSDSGSDESDDDGTGGESGDSADRPTGADVEDGVAHDMEMDVDADSTGAGEDVEPAQTPAQAAKGKQRAVDPVPAPAKRRPRKKQQRPVYTLRPILTIHRSQGFVWNQDLFVPPYIKDRYVASTSPPNSTGFISTSVSSTNSALTDYEIEVVEIRVQEGEFDGIIP